MIRTATVTSVTSAGVWVQSSWLPGETGPLMAMGEPSAGDSVIVFRTDDNAMIAMSSVDTRYSPPVGSMQAYAGSTAPTHWLLCAGQAVSRTTYKPLYDVIGTTYGAGDASTTFNLPDLRGRVAAGLDNMGGTDAGRLDWANTRGTTGGTQTHTLTAAESGLPAHSHNVTWSNGSNTVLGAGGGVDAQLTLTGNAYTLKSFTIDNNSAASASSAHNNMQPTMLLNYIIRAT